MIKILIVIIVLTNTINLSASVLVVKALKNIQYKDKIEPSIVYLDYTNKLKTTCIPVTKKEILKFKYKAKQFLKKDRIICKKDVYIAQQNRIIFKFGSIEIEKNGKVLNDTNKYVRFIDENGKIEKIYKDGQK